MNAIFGLLFFLLFSAEAALFAPRFHSSNELFDGPIRIIRLELSPEGVEGLRSSPREYVEATATEGTNVYERIGVHLKGSAGSFRPIGDRPSFTVKFDNYVVGQRFFGLEKMHLNNCTQDPTFIREILASEMFLMNDIPTPRAVNVLVEMNGRSLGVYVLKAAFDRTLLRQHFSKVDGNLYDGGFRTDVTALLEKDSGTGPTDHSDLKALASVAAEPDHTKWRSKLEALVEIDRFVALAAVEVMIGHWDGYFVAANNYRIYSNPETARFVFMPHGMDQVFGNPDLPIVPRVNSVVGRGLLSTSEGKAKYLETFERILREKYDVERITNRVDQLSERVRKIVVQSDLDRAAEYLGGVRDLKNRILRRKERLARELNSLGE